LHPLKSSAFHGALLCQLKSIDTVKVGVGQESFAVPNLQDYGAAKFLPRTVE
jgi:hypothetical protein